jgi:acetoacetate decarboxylase
MARLRYVKNMSGSQAAATKGVTHNTVRSIRAVYETDREVAAALLPKPLVPLDRPEIFIQFAHVAMHFSPTRTVTIGAMTAAVRCRHEDTVGGYVLVMSMEGENIVVKGRETFGEPKKIAKVDFNIEGDKFQVACTRHNIAFIELKGSIGASKGPKKFDEHFFCYKAQPAIARGDGFDGDVFLTQLDWKRDYTDVRTIDGEINLQDSAYDPLVYVPVRRIVSMEYAEGTTQTSGKILRIVPGEWLAPFIHQRYDDKHHSTLELDIAGRS